MKCQREGCQEPSVAHITEINAGEVSELHLCLPHSDEVFNQTARLQEEFRQACAASRVAPSLVQWAVPSLFQWAVESLSSLKAEEAIPQFIELLKHEHPVVRWAAVLALGRMGHGNAAAIEAMRARLQDGDGRVREAAAWVLPQIEQTRREET